jgi:hypothetical protein
LPLRVLQNKITVSYNENSFENSKFHTKKPLEKIETLSRF